MLKPFIKSSSRALGKQQDLDNAGVSSISDPTGLRVLITGGYGYRNVGDEAQLGANLDRWRKLSPCARLTVLSPNPEYTAEHHCVNAQAAPRIVWFQADKTPDYFASNQQFQKQFWRVRRRMLWAAKLAKVGLPVLFASKAEAKLLQAVADSDVLHISGGGFLTGMTRSRLWENCLLMEICNILNTPVMLSGQTIGVFKSEVDRQIAAYGLTTAKLIYLRDSGASEADLAELSLIGDHIVSLCDDALFCASSDAETVNRLLLAHGIKPGDSLVVVNFHYWGMTEQEKNRTRRRFADVCRYLSTKHKKLLLLPMTPSDEESERDLLNEPLVDGYLLRYPYDFQVARGVIARSEFVITMKHHPIIFAQGEGVPSISVAVDDYYYRKNQGAQENCGHERFNLNDEEFHRDVIFQRIDELICNRRTLSAELNSYIEKLKPRAGEPITRFLSQI